jgi:hypothetical protein
VRIPVGFTVFVRLGDTLVSVAKVTIRKLIVAVGERHKSRVREIEA